MSQATGIQWTSTTWNPIVGCTRVSSGCDNCYAAQLAATRLKGLPDYAGLAVVTPSGRAAFTGTVRVLEDRLADPLRWRKPRRVFVNSMSDLFHEGVSEETIAALFGIMAAAPQHTFQILTKRPERMRDVVQRLNLSQALFRAAMILPEEGFQRWRRSHFSPPWPLPNVWLGVSAEDQATADERIPLLLQTPAAVRFISAEPLLGPTDLRLTRAAPLWSGDGPGASCLSSDRLGLHWVIAGGESGSNARPCQVEWIRSIVQQCRAAGVRCFVKQLGTNPVQRQSGVVIWPDFPLHDRKGGDMEEWPADLRVRDFPAPVPA